MIWTGHLAVSSTGSLSHDEIGHYLLSRYTIEHPANALDTWGRAAQTLVYALPARAGLLAARLFSVLLAGLVAFLSTLLAKNLGVRKWTLLVPLLLFFQPWYASFMFGVITEVPFALFLVAGIYFWSAERFEWASLAAGMLALTRHEGVLLTGLWFLFVLYRRHWQAAVVCVLPLLLYNGAYWAVHGEPAFAIYFRARPTSFYGSGDWLHLIRPLRYAIGAPVLALSALGLWPAKNLGTRLRFLAPFLVYLVMHAAIYRYGLFGSGGYLEFLLPTAPLFAVLATLGTEWSARTAQRVLRAIWKTGSLGQGSVGELAVRIGVAVAVLAYGITRSEPTLLATKDNAMRLAVQWLEENNLERRPTVSTHVWFWYFRHEPVGPHNYWWLIPDIDTLPIGQIVVWDDRYSDRWGLRRADLTVAASHWRSLRTFDADTSVVIFERYR